MDYTAILSVIVKGLAVVASLIQAEQDAEPAIKALINLATGAKQGTVTTDQLNATETLLDQLIANFNTDMPV